MKMRAIIVGLLWVLLIGWVDMAGAVPAVSYTNTYDAGTGTWTYESTILNDSSDLLYDLVLYPAVEAIAGADLTLYGWGTADIGSVSPYFVHWMSDFGAEIAPGETRGGFWFSYSGGVGGEIGHISFTATMWDPVNETPYSIDGQTASASSVPEPGTIWLLITGFAGLWMLGKKRGLLVFGKGA